MSGVGGRAEVGFVAARSILKVLAAQYNAIGAEIVSIGKSILAWHRSCEPSRRLEEIPGIGPIVATALVAEIGDWKAFRSGRGLAAWIGLVPKQHTTGGKDRLGSITKQGNRYLRWLLVPGAMAVIRYAQKHGTKKHPWLGQLMARRPTKVAARCLSQQDCPDGMGDHGSRREIQGANAGGIGSRQIGEAPIGEGMTT
jgi:transposase